MRKLILQMQMSVDGFVGNLPGDHISWQVWGWGDQWPWDPHLKSEFNGTVAATDTILLSRPMITEGYLDHWAAVAERNRDNPEFDFARRIVSANKVVATGQEMAASWDKTVVATGPLAATIGELKRAPGKNIICFGGSGFGAALLSAKLVDELQLYVNPTALGRGTAIFENGWRFDLLSARQFDCGIVVQKFRPKEPMNGDLRS